MEDNKTGNPLFSKPVVDMFTVANEYCLFFDKAEEYKADEIFEYFHKITPLLYLKGSLVPVVQVNDPTYTERFLTEEQYESLFLVLKEKFENRDTFYIFDANYEPVKASLAECMTDIYQDMKDFVWLYRKDNSFEKENSIMLIKELFEQRWGLKILNALEAIHNIKYDINPDGDYFEEDDNLVL